MGRKVHPIGFRLKVVKDWDGRWFATGRRYAEQLHEDLAIRRLIMGLDRAAVSRIEIQRFPGLVHVTIYTAKPGIVIGRKGVNVKALRANLEAICVGNNVKVDIEEISQPDLDAKLIADSVANQLERRIGHRRAMKRAINNAMRDGAQGIKVMCSGRLMGREMSRREWLHEGRGPLQTLRADIDFAISEAKTSYGVIGVKVWVYKGDVLREDQPEATDVYISE